jgi:pimeloyl-ACP methyl ester carboxylesterase
MKRCYPRSHPLKRLLLVIIICGLGSFGTYYLFPGLVLHAAKPMYRVVNGFEHRSLQIEAMQWSYLEGGQGEPILFLHGFGSDKYRIAMMMAPLRSQYHVIAPDLPGFGETTRSLAMDYGIPQMARYLEAFVEAKGLSRFHLVGSSMGGYLAGYYASEHPQQVLSVALMDAAGVRSPEPSLAWKLFAQQGQNILLYQSVAEFNRLMDVLFIKPPWIPRRIRNHVAQLGISNRPLRQKIMTDIIASGIYLLESRLTRIEAPTLVIWGRQDQVLDVSSVAVFLAGIPQSRAAIIENCGHVPYIEKPEQTQRIYTRFLNSLPAGLEAQAARPYR